MNEPIGDKKSILTITALCGLVVAVISFFTISDRAGLFPWPLQTLAVVLGITVWKLDKHADGIGLWKVVAGIIMILSVTSWWLDGAGWFIKEFFDSVRYLI